MRYAGVDPGFKKGEAYVATEANYDRGEKLLRLNMPTFSSLPLFTFTGIIIFARSQGVYS